MDVLSQLIDLAHLRTALDIHCLLGGEFRVENEAAGRGILPFHLVLGGECIIELDLGRRATLKSGDMLLLPRGHSHAITNVKAHAKKSNLVVDDEGLLPQRRSQQVETDVELLCGHFEYDPRSSALLLDSLPDIFQASLTRQQSEGRLSALVGILKDEAGWQLPGALTIMAATSLALLAMALRTRDASDVTPGLPALMRDERLAKSVRAMVKDSARPWTIEKLGAMSAMSRATYARRFKEASGMTVGDFLTELRMMQAGDLLARTSRSVADIAAEVGYEFEAAFGKAFRNSKGLPPGKFRRTASGDEVETLS